MVTERDAFRTWNRKRTSCRTESHAWMRPAASLSTASLSRGKKINWIVNEWRSQTIVYLPSYSLNHSWFFFYVYGRRCFAVSFFLLLICLSSRNPTEKYIWNGYIYIELYPFLLVLHHRINALHCNRSYTIMVAVRPSHHHHCCRKTPDTHTHHTRNKKIWNC